jgi:hypothetical protein
VGVSVSLAPSGPDGKNPDLQPPFRLSGTCRRYFDLELDIMNLELELLIASSDRSGLQFRSHSVNKICQRYALLRLCHIAPYLHPLGKAQMINHHTIQLGQACNRQNAAARKRRRSSNRRPADCSLSSSSPGVTVEGALDFDEFVDALVHCRVEGGDREWPGLRWTGRQPRPTCLERVTRRRAGGIVLSATFRALRADSRADAIAALQPRPPGT